MRYLILLLSTLVACSGNAPAGSGVVAYGVAIQHAVPNDDDEPLDYRIVCMGTAIGEHEILTASHCVEGETVIPYVDRDTWERTSSLALLADVGEVSGENVTLRTRRALPHWVDLAPVSDGPAELVVLRFDNFVALPTVLAGGSLLAGVDHGDSGAGVFRNGALVGVLQACVDLNGDDVCEPGARFSAAAP